VAETRPQRDVMLIWLPSGSKATLADFAQGARFDDVESAVIFAAKAPPNGMLPWVCCERQFVMNPEDIVLAFGQMWQAGA